MLNPHTQDEDLEIIFSPLRNEIKACDVIRDPKTTGDSLQNAFIEFPTEGFCEEAFYRMDNVIMTSS